MKVWKSVGPMLMGFQPYISLYGAFIGNALYMYKVMDSRYVSAANFAMIYRVQDLNP
ncbi:MAG: hypothetical protein R3208_09090 [Ketobacteraceae bacterium]|nr:hypothetical protein [Ketobacteraceae bacterium]